jgi:hypothetical protein
MYAYISQVTSFLISQRLQIIKLPFTHGRRDSSAGIMTDYELNSLVSITGRGKRYFSTPQRPNRLCGPPSLLSTESRGVFHSGLICQVLKADHSPPSSTKVNNGGTIPPLPHTSSWRAD